MTDQSVGQSAGAAAPVFVDSSGGRRRRWRRLGWAMGAAGGGYALMVAVSVIGGNSDAPWGVLIPGSDENKPGAVRVVPERDDDARTQIPEAADARSDEPSARTFARRPSVPGANNARTPGTSSEASPGARASSGTGAEKPLADGGGNKGGGTGGTTEGSGGTASESPSPTAEPAAGGTTSSTDGSSDPEPVPTDSTTAPPQGGAQAEDGSLLDQVIDQLEGGPDDSADESADGSVMAAPAGAA